MSYTTTEQPETILQPSDEGCFPKHLQQSPAASSATRKSKKERAFQYTNPQQFQQQSKE